MAENPLGPEWDERPRTCAQKWAWLHKIGATAASKKKLESVALDIEEPQFAWGQGRDDHKLPPIKAEETIPKPEFHPSDEQKVPEPPRWMDKRERDEWYFNDMLDCYGADYLTDNLEGQSVLSQWPKRSSRKPKKK